MANVAGRKANNISVEGALNWKGAEETAFKMSQIIVGAKYQHYNYSAIIAAMLGPGNRGRLSGGLA